MYCRRLDGNELTSAHHCADVIIINGSGSNIHPNSGVSGRLFHRHLGHEQCGRSAADTSNGNWKHFCPRRIATAYYRLRNILTYLLTYFLMQPPREDHNCRQCVPDISEIKNSVSGVASSCCEEGQSWKLGHGALTVNFRACQVQQLLDD